MGFEKATFQRAIYMYMTQNKNKDMTYNNYYLAEKTVLCNVNIIKYDLFQNN